MSNIVNFRELFLLGESPEFLLNFSQINYF